MSTTDILLLRQEVGQTQALLLSLIQTIERQFSSLSPAISKDEMYKVCGVKSDQTLRTYARQGRIPKPTSAGIWNRAEVLEWMSLGRGVWAKADGVKA